MGLGLKYFFGVIILSTTVACQKSGSSKPEAAQPVPKPVVADPFYTTEDIPGTTPETDVSSEPLADQACIKSLCGAKDPMPHPFTISDDASPKANAAISEKVEKPLKNYMGRLIHRALLIDSLTKKVLAKDSVRLTPDQVGFLQAARSIKDFKNYRAAWETNANNSLVLNKEKLKEILGPGKEVEAEAIATYDDFVQFLWSPRGSLLQSGRSLEMVLKVFYPELPLTDALKEESKFIVTATKDISSIVDFRSSESPRFLVVRKALAGEPLTFAEKKIFKRQMSDSRMLSLLSAPKVIEAFKKVPLATPAVLEETRQKYANSKQAKIMATPQGLKPLLNETVSSCSAKLAAAYAAFPSAEQVTRFRAIFKSLQETTQAMVEEKAKASMTSPLNIELSLPPTRDEALQSWTSSLQEGVQEFDKQLKIFKQLEASNESDAGTIFIGAALWSDDDIFSEIIEFCDQARAPSLDDAALSRVNIVNISWTSIVYPKAGIGVIAHELGHIVEGNWPDLVKSEMSCLSEKQGGSQQYASEDFADLFSAELVRRMNFKVLGIPTSNFACALLKRTESGWASAALKNEDASDSHSSHFFRLMAVAEMSGQQSNSCRSYLESVQETRFQNYCAWSR